MNTKQVSTDSSPIYSQDYQENKETQQVNIENAQQTEPVLSDVDPTQPPQITLSTTYEDN